MSKSSSDLAHTGASIIASCLQRMKFDTVYTYPGTSELALCAALAAQSGVSVRNSRGDKEAVFFAAGHNLIKPGRGVALVHGARGATNALGAIASARRNEIGVLVLVGLPSRASQAFLPPHGERDLIKNVGAFAKNFCDFSDLPATDGPATEALISDFRRFASLTREMPVGPIVIGLPQDFLEQVCPTISFIEDGPTDKRMNSPQDISVARELWDELQKAKNETVFLIDDPIFRDDELAENISALADYLGVPVFQVSYLRGPMLFQRYRRNRPASYAMYDPASTINISKMWQAKLIVTFEDRNMYERVVGRLPQVRKIGLTSNIEITRKNGYGTLDRLISCHVGELTQRLVTLANDALPVPPVRSKQEMKYSSLEPHLEGTKTGAILETIAAAIRATATSIVVDDSQMFGGLIAQNYGYMFSAERVFGDHSGFVGGGIASAIGAALADSLNHIWCFCGDQGFVNGFQGLAGGVEMNCSPTVLVFNNGGSVSLTKQMRHGSSWSDYCERVILANGPTSPSMVAKALGCWSEKIDFGQPLPNAIRAFKAALQTATSDGRAKIPHVIEIVAPVEPEVWTNIWRTEGFETP